MQRKRAIAVAVLSGIGAFGLTAGTAGAAPSNRNTEVIQATCDTGQSITISVVHKQNEIADLVSAGPLVGGGVATVASVTAFAPGTTDVLFTVASKYGGPVNAECSGTLTEGGESFDFVAQVHLVGV
jgi:hypothetical protein